MTATLLVQKQYVEQLNSGYRIQGKRVSLDSVLHQFLAGESPDSIVESFPSLTLEEIYGAIAFYLANRTLLDDYLAKGEKLFEDLQQESQKKESLLYQQLKKTS